MLFILFIIFNIIVEKVAKKILRIEKKMDVGQSAKKVDRWGKTLLLIPLLITLIYMHYNNILGNLWFGILFIVVIFGYQSIIEWKFLKNSKQYLLTIVLIISYSLSWIIFVISIS
jgi:hypothetical protein